MTKNITKKETTAHSQEVFTRQEADAIIKRIDKFSLKKSLNYENLVVR